MKHLQSFNENSKYNSYVDLLMELTKKTTPAGKEGNIEHILFRYGFQKDEHGNYFIRNLDESNVLFTAHADNYCKTEKEVDHLIEDRCLKSDGTTILGGDNKVGICYIIALIEAGWKYNYYIFKSEEIGRVGSKILLEKDPEFLSNIDLVIAFDRKDVNSIITSQRGCPCASYETSLEIKEEFGKKGISLNLSNEGGSCDTFTFRNVIPECINISSGTFDEHTFNEYVDLDFFGKMITTIPKIDFNKISINREIEEYKTWSYKISNLKIPITEDLFLYPTRICLDEDTNLTCYFNVNADIKRPYKVVFAWFKMDKGRLVKLKYVPKGQKVEPKTKDVEKEKKKVVDFSEETKELMVVGVYRYLLDFLKRYSKK